MPTKQDPPEDAPRYIVAHDMVGPYHRGQAVTVAHLKLGQLRDIDLDRLLRLGALLPAGSARADDLLGEYPPEAKTREDQPVHADVPLPPLDVTHPDNPINRAQQAGQPASTS